MNPSDDLFDDLQRRALRDAAEASRDLDEESVDLIEVLRPGDVERGDAPDRTLGGYIEEHDRPPAFEGKDGQPYTVGIETEETGDPARPWVAFFVFIRWAATGAGIMAHVETPDVASGATEEEAKSAALELSLYEVKTELDAAIDRKRAALEE
jgi:hypothetical protein